MKNNGFTLVELLAVIILIGLIAVITIPKIKDSLDDSKKEIAQASAVNYSKQIDKLVLEEKMKNNSILLDGDYNIDSNGNIYNEENEYVIDVSGKKPTGGTITFSENDLQSGCITVNKYAVTIVNGEVANIAKGDCEYQSIEDNIIAIAQNYANSVKTVKGNVTNIFDVPVEGVTSNKVTAGWVALVEGEIDSYSLKIGAYVVTLANGNTTVSRTTEIATKATANINALVVYLTGDTDIESQDDGAIYIRDAIEVYYNPVNGKLCDSSNSVSATGTTTGCMHWYLYSIKGTYGNMLLDHNITEANAKSGYWITSSDYSAGLTPIMDGETVTGYQTTEGTGSKATSTGVTYPNTVTTFPAYGRNSGQSLNARGPLTVLNSLKTLTLSWKTETPKVPNSSSTNEHIILPDMNNNPNQNNMYQIDYTGYHARLITLDETIFLGCQSASNTCPTWMDKGTMRDDSTIYADIQGYWTSSKSKSSAYSAWYYTGFIQCDWADYYRLGIRPVITVQLEDIL